MPWQISVWHDRELIPYDVHRVTGLDIWTRSDFCVVDVVATMGEAGRIVRDLRNQGQDRVTIDLEKVADMPMSEPEPEPEIKPDVEPVFVLDASPIPRRRTRTKRTRCLGVTRKAHD